MTEQEILNLIEQDRWMMGVLLTASAINLQDWLIGAGFVRNKIWDHLSNNLNDKVKTADIDLVYYDPKGNDKVNDEILSKQLKDSTGMDWEVVNEFYAHKLNNDLPYKSTIDAISRWPETVTAIGVTLDKKNKLQLIAPYGINDLVNFIVRPTPYFTDKADIVNDRVSKKKWTERWPNIQIA